MLSYRFRSRRLIFGDHFFQILVPYHQIATAHDCDWDWLDYVLVPSHEIRESAQQADIIASPHLGNYTGRFTVGSLVEFHKLTCPLLQP